MLDPPEGAQVIVSHQGAPLTKVLKDMLRFSTNLTAEVLGMRASGARTLEGSGMAMSLWAERELGAKLSLQDHSGLNSANRVTARDMLKVIARAPGLGQGGLLEGLMREVGATGAEGAVEAGVRVRAKSGTMNFVSGLAGYIGAEGGQPLGFAIFSADVPRREAVPVAEREDPSGAGPWVKRARRMQGQMIANWAGRYL